jgi:hypothetical protein
MLRKISRYVCLALLLTACATPILQPTPTAAIDATNITPMSPKLVLDWLENPACSPPCWEGIMPGVTLADAARTILQKYPDAAVEPSNDGSIVRRITLNLSLYDYLPLELVLSKYGQPDYVHIFKCDPNSKCDVNIIYEKLGLILDPYLDNVGKSQTAIVDIFPKNHIVKFYFIEPGLENYRNMFGGPGEIQDWHGFGTYSSPWP